MNIISLYLGGCLIGGGIAGVLSAIAGRERGAERAPEEDAPEREEGEGVLVALLGALRSLDKQKAAGFGCWIPSCIEKCREGYSVSADVALLALTWTREELTGRRYDLAGLDKAIAELEKEYQL